MNTGWMAKIKVQVGSMHITLYSRGRNWGKVVTSEWAEAGTFESKQAATKWLESIFNNAQEWTIIEVYTQ